jgi:hypothetical protein
MEFMADDMRSLRAVSRQRSTVQELLHRLCRGIAEFAREAAILIFSPLVGLRPSRSVVS